MIRAGFIGVGGISAAHLKCLQSRKDVRIAALCDVNREQILKRQGEYGGQVFTDFNEMLDRAALDAVWLCTPPSIRREPLLACAARKIPVFCEKPVERDEKRGKQIALELARRKARVQVGYVFRSLPVVQELRKIIADDRIHLVHSFYGCGVSLDMSLPKWLYDKSKSGGIMIEQGTHNLDLLRYLFGEVAVVRGTAANPVRKKRAGYTIDETIGLIMTFRGGIIATHAHSWVADRWRNEMTFSGEKRFYRLDLSAGSLSTDLPGTETGRLYRGKGRKTAAQSAPFNFQQETRSIYKYENDAFIRQVITRNWKNNPSDYRDGLKSFHLALACERALAGGLVKV